MLTLLLLLTLPSAVQAQFTFTTNNGAITITGYTGPGGTVSIPRTINFGGVDLPVISIGSYAFYYCTNLTSITIPDSVTNIGEEAFLCCTNLANVSIPDSITSIGGWAFYSCTSLTNITIPNSVTSIGSFTFCWCTGLTDMTIPNGVTNIGTWAFAYCKGMTSVTISSGVTSIGDYEFYGCTSLTSATIPKSVTSIGNWAFDSTRLTSVTIPGSVIRIGDYAFSYCSGLTSVTISNGLTRIGDYEFYGCTSLTSATIPKSVTSIGAGAFTFCSSLAAIKVDPLNSYYASLGDVLFNKSQTTLIQYPAAKAGAYTIPDGITNILDSAFYGSTGLTRVTIPRSVASIGRRAFADGSTLTEITVDPLNSYYASLGDVLFNKSQTTLIQYPAGKTAATYAIPNSVSGIGEWAFEGCTSLTSATIPNTVTSIGIWAFSDCRGLTGVYFKGNAPGLGDNAFAFDYHATVYYLPGTKGWSLGFGGLPVVLWNPQVQTSGASFGVRTNRFGFTITGTSNLVIVVEAFTDLANPLWSPLGTNRLIGGSSYFSDPQWTNYPTRFYRLRSP